MSPVLGKRKRRGQTDGDISGLVIEDTNTARLEAFFQQHFESTFDPLEGLDLQSMKVKRNEAAKHLVASDSDWAGFSESEDAEDGKPAVVVECSTHRSSRADFPKEELKTFMVGVAPIYRQISS